MGATRRVPAIYLCGPDPVLREQPCPAGGPNHDPAPAGYDSGYEYAAQLLTTGWQQHRCPTCGLWTLWRLRDGAQGCLPPPLIRDEPWEIPDDVEGTGCTRCDEQAPCPAVTR